MSVDAIAAKVTRGERIDADEARMLYREASTWQLGRLADAIRARRHPERLVTYIIDRNVNYTNVCVARCNFCAFYRTVGQSRRLRAVASTSSSPRSTRRSASAATSCCCRAGTTPTCRSRGTRTCSARVKAAYPTFRLHALSPPEILHISRMSQLPVPEVVARLIAAGLDSVPGGGAEILVDRVRKLLNCYGKATADEWLDVMREAHLPGLRTTATMMYGTVETAEERLEHMMRLRELQDETGGFTAFITWSYQPDHTELAGVEATGVEYLRTLAIARIVLDNFDNLQASWVTQGGKVGQLSLAFGANDMGSVMIEENVVRAAGASYCMDEVEIVAQHRERRLHAHAPHDALRPAGRRRSSASAPCRGALSLDVAKQDGAELMPPNWRPTRRAAARAASSGANLTLSAASVPLSRLVLREGIMIVRVHAGWVVPIVAPVLRGGWIDVDVRRGEIVGVGAAGTADGGGSVIHDRPERGRAHARPRQRPHAPRVVALAGAVPPASNFVAWVRAMLGVPRRHAGHGARRRRAMRSSARSRRWRRPAPWSSATSATPRSRSCRSPARRLCGSCLHEVLGVQGGRRGTSGRRHALARVRTHRAPLCRGHIAPWSPSVAPHAPYSTSPPLIQAHRAGVRTRARRVVTCTWASRPRRSSSCAQGSGPMPRACSTTSAPGTRGGRRPASAPVPYLGHLGVLHAGLLVVHGTQ